MVLDLPLLFFSSSRSCCFTARRSGISTRSAAPRLLHLPLVMGLGIGLAFSNARAVLGGAAGSQIRICAHAEISASKKTDDETWKRKKYKRKRGWLPLLELGFAVYFLLAIALRGAACTCGAPIPFLLLFFFGFGYMGMMSLLQSFGINRRASRLPASPAPSN